MYTLYFSPGACSLATHTILNVLGQPVDIINKDDEPDFLQLNPLGLVPVLKDGDKVLTEGLPILHYLLNKHDNELWPQEQAAQHKALENMAFANATVHPAYGRLFFLAGAIANEEAKLEAMTAAAEKITLCWQAVEQKLADQPFLGGGTMSPADILLAVYANWGQFFAVNITIGPKAQKMIDAVQATEAYQAAVASQQHHTAKA